MSGVAEDLAHGNRLEKGGEAMEADDKKQEALLEAAHVLEENRTGIVLTGRIRDGKVELDKRTLDEIAEKFARSNVAFVAVNAPFDPNSGQA